MRAVSASIVILAGSILWATAGLVREEAVRLLLGFFGLVLVGVGVVAWYYFLAVDGAGEGSSIGKRRRPVRQGSPAAQPEAPA